MTRKRKTPAPQPTAAKYRVELLRQARYTPSRYWFRIVRISNRQIIATSEIYQTRIKRDTSAKHVAESAGWPTVEGIYL